MAHKDGHELACIREACRIAEEAFALLLPELKEGMTELEAAGLLPPGLETLTGSDAHALLSLREDFPLLGPDSVLWPLVEQLPAPE